MDWKDLAGTLIKTGAPIIGTALGGPLGGTIGGVAGRIIADALGVAPTPEAVHEAIRTDPEGAMARLSDADAKWQAMAEIARAEAADRTAQSQAINETMRAEAAANVSSVSKWHWRNTIGHLVVLYGLQQVLLIFVSAFLPKVLPPTDLVQLFNATVVFTGGLFALLGYVASDTTDRYKTAITGDRGSGGVVEKVIAAVKPTKPVVVRPLVGRDP